MKKEIKKLENSKYEVTVSCDAEAWKAAQEKAYKELMKNVSYKGFRKGNVPEQIIKQHHLINEAETWDRAIRYVLQPMYEDVLADGTIRPFAQPNVNVTKVSNEEMEAVFTIVSAPEVELGEYKGLHVEKGEVVVKDEDVEAEVAKAQKQNATLTVCEREAKLGDTVSIDFEGFVDGVAFEGGKAENYDLELGSGSFIPGFEEQLVGVKAEEEKDINVKFPENYVENLKGKDATFKIKVHEVKEKVIPEVNDDLVAELNIKDVTTVAQWKDHIKADLTKKAEVKVANDYYQGLVKLIRESSKIEMPKEIIDSEVAAMKENMKNQMAQQGLELDQYLSITGQTMEALDAQLASEADINVRSVLVLEKIAAQEKITITDAELDAEFANIAAQYGMEVEKVKEALKGSIDRVAQDVRSRKIHDFLVANNN